MKRIEVTSAHNALVKQLRKAVQDNAAYRKTGQIWLEGDHLCRAYLARGGIVAQWVVAASYEPIWRTWVSSNAKNVAENVPLTGDIRAGMTVGMTGEVPTVWVLDDALMKGVSSLESAAKVGALIDVPAASTLRPHAPTLVLDRVQDAGNVGAMLRSASAFGVEQVLAIKGTAALWSPKVLRAGMGAHFGLKLFEGLAVADLASLTVPLMVTSSHQGDWLHQAALPTPCAWVMGHEGQGVSEEIAALSGVCFVRIAQPGGEESLNVACAASICLYASSVAVGT